MAPDVHPDAVATSFAALLSFEDDDVIRAPLWEFAPHERKAVISERRRRFGVDDDEGVGVG